MNDQDRIDEQRRLTNPLFSGRKLKLGTFCSKISHRLAVTILSLCAGMALPFFVAQASAQTWGPDAKGVWEFDAPRYAGWGDYKPGRSTPSKATITISLPQGEGPFPAVIVAHSSGGWHDRKEGIYANELRAAGYVVAALDHFGPRGVKSTVDGGSLTVTAMSDALLALKLLATHPKVRADRIGITGLSMGGETAEWTIYEHLRSRLLPGTTLKFAAHVSIYGSCGFIFGDDLGKAATTGAPMLRLRGGKDELAPAEKCDRIDALVRAVEPGALRETIVYQDAYHAWDEAQGLPRLYPNATTSRKCPVIDWGPRQRFIEPNGTERVFERAEFTACLNAGTGYWQGYSPVAAREAPKAMRAFFDRHLKAP